MPVKDSGLYSKRYFAPASSASCFSRLRAVHRDLADGRLVLFEHLFALGDGRGIVDVHDRVLGAADGVERLADDVLARLREHLHRHVVGDEPVVDEGAQEGVFGIAGGGEADLDLLKADLDEQV